MNLTVGTTTVEITSCTRRRDVQRGFYLDIKIPKENIPYDDLEALLDGTEESIIITEDDGSETTYNGFKLLYSIMVKEGVYHVEQCCVSEIEAQLSLAQNTIKAQAEVIAAQGETIACQEQEILSQAEVIVAQGETIVSMWEEMQAMIEEQVNAAVAVALEK